MDIVLYEVMLGCGPDRSVVGAELSENFGSHWHCFFRNWSCHKRIWCNLFIFSVLPEELMKLIKFNHIPDTFCCKQELAENGERTGAVCSNNEEYQIGTCGIPVQGMRTVLLFSCGDILWQTEMINKSYIGHTT